MVTETSRIQLTQGDQFLENREKSRNFEQYCQNQGKVKEIIGGKT
jgi:hypothetical protein